MSKIWAQKNARYVFPTTELVAWLKGFIARRKAIEVGAGMGDLGKAVGIQMTDSHVQTSPELRLYYQMSQCAITEPPADVEKIDAVMAVEKYNPDVVVAGFLTQRFEPGDDGTPKVNSSVYGPNEFEILAHPSVQAYVHVGNIGPHGDKRILKLPHKTLYFPWLVTRAFDQSKNVIYVWGE